MVINECLTFNTNGLVDEIGELEDWVEIHNPTTAPVDLSGYYITDRLNNPTKWRVPLDAGSEVVIAPDGYLLLWADDDTDQGWNHMGFRLNNNGEALVLRSPDGFSIADSVHFGVSQPDFSYARIPNASGPFEWVAEPTPNACNDCTDAVATLNPSAGRLMHGPNPVCAGQAVWLDASVQVWSLEGKWVAELDQGWNAWPQGLSGVYMIIDAKGRAVRIVVVAN